MRVEYINGVYICKIYNSCIFDIHNSTNYIQQVELTWYFIEFTCFPLFYTNSAIKFILLLYAPFLFILVMG